MIKETNKNKRINYLTQDNINAYTSGWSSNESTPKLVQIVYAYLYINNVNSSIKDMIFMVSRYILKLYIRAIR
mgnify:CR=1 FL=1